MNTNVKRVCGVLTAHSDFKIYTILMLIYNWGSNNYHTKTKNSNEMPNNSFTTYIYRTDVLPYRPIH